MFDIIVEVKYDDSDNCGGELRCRFPLLFVAAGVDLPEFHNTV